MSTTNLLTINRDACKFSIAQLKAITEGTIKVVIRGRAMCYQSETTLVFGEENAIFREQDTDKAFPKFIHKVDEKDGTIYINDGDSTHDVSWANTGIVARLEYNISPEELAKKQALDEMIEKGDTIQLLEKSRATKISIRDLQAMIEELKVTLASELEVELAIDTKVKELFQL